MVKVYSCLNLGIEVGKPHFVYTCIGVMRVLLNLEKSSEAGKNHVKLLMTHSEERQVRL